MANENKYLAYIMIVILIIIAVIMGINLPTDVENAKETLEYQGGNCESDYCLSPKITNMTYYLCPENATCEECCGVYKDYNLDCVAIVSE